MQPEEESLPYFDFGESNISEQNKFSLYFDCNSDQSFHEIQKEEHEKEEMIQNIENEKNSVQYGNYLMRKMDSLMNSLKSLT